MPAAYIAVLIIMLRLNRHAEREGFRRRLRLWRDTYPPLRNTVETDQHTNVGADFTCLAIARGRRRISARTDLFQQGSRPEPYRQGLRQAVEPVV